MSLGWRSKTPPIRRLTAAVAVSEGMPGNERGAVAAAPLLLTLGIVVAAVAVVVVVVAVFVVLTHEPREPVL